MKTVAAVSTTPNPSCSIRQTGALPYGWSWKRRTIDRFRRFIESVDWEEWYLFHHGADKFCAAVIIAAVLYFFPRMVILF